MYRKRYCTTPVSAWAVALVLALAVALELTKCRESLRSSFSCDCKTLSGKLSCMWTGLIVSLLSGKSLFKGKK